MRYGRKVVVVGELCTLQDYSPQNAMLTQSDAMETTSVTSIKIKVKTER